jgi:glycosyltransferase involved in cell wall biosynthesis
MNPNWIPLNSEPRLEFVPLPVFHGPKQYALQYFKVGKAIQKIVAGCDAAVLRLPSTVAQRICYKVMEAKIPYATEIVFDAMDGFKSNTNPIHKLLNLIIHFQMVSSCRKAWGVSCVTEHYLQKRYYSQRKGHFESHYSSLALDKAFYTSPRKFPTKQEFTIVNVANQVQFNGRKGFNQIIEALAVLKEKNLPVKAIFVGGNYNNGIPKLQEYARQLGVLDRVTFTGYQNRTQLSEWLDKSDLYVMPTLAEGLPRVIIEAMAKGLPAITTPVSGNPELVGSKFLVEYYDVDRLAATIEELLQNPDLYEVTSKENFERSQQYEASILQARRDKFYQQLKDSIRQ